jgi:precorrin-6B C5,15-methyltransferase / cobalt-precorrin-6B C5,C15-methyltransferase
VGDGAQITVVGVSDERLETLPPEARRALAGASCVVGGRRHLALWRSWGLGDAETIEVGGSVDDVASTVRRRGAEEGGAVCVLASGDPGFFGILRSLLRTVDRRSLRVLPAPSSVSLAFARLALPWDDAVVVSAHGRPLAAAVDAVRTARKAAVLTSPDVPPEALGAALAEAGVSMDLVAVCERLGSGDERVVELTVEALASGRFDPLSVVVLVGPGGLPLVGWEPGNDKVLAWGGADEGFDHRAGMITKSEVRSVVLGKLALPARGVVWDVGAGSGSVAVACALAQPGLTVLAIEERPDTAARISANALAFGASVHVVPGRAPEVLAPLPAPDRVFVGGGGLTVLNAVVERVRPHGRVVAAYAALDRAAAAAGRLGHLVQVSVDRGERLPDGGWRLAAQNPVFVAWGPEDGQQERPG